LLRGYSNSLIPDSPTFDDIDFEAKLTSGNNDDVGNCVAMQLIRRNIDQSKENTAPTVKAQKEADEIRSY
jgi:hypothetical protein